MKRYRIVSVEPRQYPILHVTFDDGVSGDLDLSPSIDADPAFAPLKDEAVFRAVAVGEHGRTFGWRLDQPGREIDVCPDATRIRIETQRVEELAARFRAARFAAE